ncbi:sugar phosphate isomerase/epimerase family protein [Anaerotalea alkaliphila]|uniref:Sugar phosphate isomerase/epimerase n=1 Tax=Anaerotalea alkaliphila TaxID=2662126 RepID=A0A7X5HTU8_9FIRM|nr:sugar phosphate isomerase/epimerase [Anaerotalea alkaliphila]NDL66445.1 sugar phosphate isomerase/epimerase [Anaerotalea alkaliphila]
MILSICTDSLGNLAYEDMLDAVKGMGINYVEMTVGGWSPAPHIRVDELLGSEGKLAAFQKALTDRGMGIAALNCSGNPLDPGTLGEEHRVALDKTLDLAKALGVKKIVAMSGLPAGAPGDKVPNWITNTINWTPLLREAVRYQWEDVAIPYWKKVVEKAKECGVEKIALENFPNMLVVNPETVLKLREAVGPMIGMNLDPSHLMYLGADPIQSARALGDAIHHVHGKDTRIERGVADRNGLLENKGIEDIANRSWNYVAVGCGKDLQWWKEFFSVVKMMGYNDFVSLEMEDMTMSVEAGLKTSVDALKQTISQ